MRFIQTPEVGKGLAQATGCRDGGRETPADAAQPISARRSVSCTTDVKLDTAFRLSFFVTLGMACACLAQAEAFFHAWFPFVCLPLAALVFTLAWRYEGRWVIGETASNYLGVFIGLATGGWILLQLPRSQEALISGGVPWPAGLLPHLGPLLLVLLAVKLFRPKQLADAWVIQTIGLMLVTLACVLAGDPVFTVLLAGYLVSLVWCLAIFHVYRARRAETATSLFAAADSEEAMGNESAPGRGNGLPWRLLGAGRVLCWSAMVMLAGLAMFMSLPRATNTEWIPSKLSSSAPLALTIGVESGINADRVGTVELSPEPAFHVHVSDGKGAPARLSDQQLWRVDTLDFYVRGRWMTWSQAQLYSRGGGRSSRPIPPPPPLTGNQLHFRFTALPHQAGGLPLAEPLDIRRSGLDSSLGKGRPSIELFTAVPGGDAVVPYLLGRQRLYRYTQVIEPDGGDSRRRPAINYDPSYRDYLIAQPVPPQVADWAREQLTRLSFLPAEARALTPDGMLTPEYHEAVSRAFCGYFTLSPDFTYSLKLRRQDRTIDPTADFLLNVKEGHCERFAGALALSLRALGVPTRVVKGYRGAEEEAAGEYVVRLDTAHSWVQVLVEEDGQWYWLTLDPTPGGGETVNPLSNWLGWLASLDMSEVWHRFVLNYNSDVQSSMLHYLWQGLWQSATTRSLLWQMPAVLAVGVAGVVAWRRRSALASLLRRGKQAPHVTLARSSPYAKLLATLAKHLGVRPQQGQTPLEFATVAGAALQGDPATAPWARLPAAVVHAHYRSRFGDQHLGAAEQDALRLQIADLTAALKRSTS